MVIRWFGVVVGVLAIGLAAIILGACGGSSAAGSAPAGAAAPGGALDARSLYVANCGRCHGDDLKGTTLGPPLLDAIYAPGHHSDAAFLITVRNGSRAHHWNFGPMLPIEGLNDRQIGAILAVVRAEQEAAGIR